MVLGIESVTLFSEDAKSLAKFYREKVGLTQTVEAEMGEHGETALFGFEFKEGAGFYIVDHADIKGKAKEPKRAIINFEVSDIEKKVKELKEAGVKLIQDIYHVENYGHIATFEDSDGNFFQVVKTRA